MAVLHARALRSCSERTAQLRQGAELRSAPSTRVRRRTRKRSQVQSAAAGWRAVCELPTRSGRREVLTPGLRAAVSPPTRPWPATNSIRSGSWPATSSMTTPTGHPTASPPTNPTSSAPCGNSSITCRLA